MSNREIPDNQEKKFHFCGIFKVLCWGNVRPRKTLAILFHWLPSSRADCYVQLKPIHLPNTRERFEKHH